MKRIAIFASGSGTNAENIIKYFNKSSVARVVQVLTNKKDAKVLERAKRLKINTLVFKKEDLYQKKVLLNSLKSSADLIVLAGFLWKVPQNLIDAFKNKIINIHPALLPKYGGKGMYGMNVHRAVVQNKEPKTGISIHYVNENYDQGHIIFQESVAVLPSDSAENVAEKIHELEYEYFPKIIEQVILQSND